VSLELARLGDPAIVRAYLCGGARSVARMHRALFMAGMSLRSIQADEFVPAVISGSAGGPDPRAAGYGSRAGEGEEREGGPEDGGGGG
jgi:hypothetical protein